MSRLPNKQYHRLEKMYNSHLLYESSFYRFWLLSYDGSTEAIHAVVMSIPKFIRFSYLMVLNYLLAKSYGYHIYARSHLTHADKTIDYLREEM